MTFYNNVFGRNPLGEALLDCLGLTTDKIPRFRDVYVKDNQIVVFTRTGGGNRDAYEKNRATGESLLEHGDAPWNDDLRAHPLFIRDEDEPNDNTYAHFYFRVPDDIKAVLTELPSTQSPTENLDALLKGLSEDAKI